MNTPRSSPAQYDVNEVGVVFRPLFQLRSLPIEYRWEVNRRHPYYQMFWRMAQAYYQQEPDARSLEQLLSMAGIAFLNAIGVSGDPPDPATEFEELGAEQIKAAWLSGAVHPITFRALAGLFIAILPRETLLGIGSLLVAASREEQEEGRLPVAEALFELQRLNAPVLDSFPAEPLVSINPAASARQVNESVNALLKEWRENRNLSEQRSRTDKYPDYLRVWDLREGWSGGTYDPKREQKLKEIAQQLRMPITTVCHHYQNAFELIVGHPYSPELGVRLMGPLKLSTLMTRDVGRVSKRRPTATRTHCPVPESVLLGSEAEAGDTGPVSSQADSGFDNDVAGLVERILEMIQSGLASDRIAQELELSTNAIEAIEYLRDRTNEIS